MNDSGLGNSHRQIVRKSTLLEEEGSVDYQNLTREQRVLMVWPLTLGAWKFKEPNGFQPRLQRHVVRVERRES